MRLLRPRPGNSEEVLPRIYELFFRHQGPAAGRLIRKLSPALQAKCLKQINTDIGMAYLTGRCNTAQRHWFTLHRLRRRLGRPGEGTYLGDFWTSSLGHLCLLFLYLKGANRRKETICLPSLGYPRVANPYFFNKILQHYEAQGCSFRFAEQAGLAFEQMGPNLETPAYRQQFFCNVFAEQEHQLNLKNQNLYLKPAPSAKAEALIRKHNPENRPIVCLHLREGGFYREAGNLRAGRNADIRTCLPAAAWLVDQGAWVVRLGDASMRPLDPALPVFDYAHSPEKCPELDIEIPARSAMFVLNNSGYALMPILFDIPAAYVQFMPLGCRPWHARAYLLPKKYFSRKENRLLTFRELLAPPFGHVESLDFLARKGIDLLENSEAEVLRCVQEVWWEYVKKSGPTESYRNELLHEIAEEKGGYRGAPLSISFLRENRSLWRSTPLGHRLRPLLAQARVVAQVWDHIRRVKYLAVRKKTGRLLDAKKILLRAERAFASGRIQTGRYLLRKSMKIRKNWQRALNVSIKNCIREPEYPQILELTSGQAEVLYGKKSAPGVMLALGIFQNPSQASEKQLRQTQPVVENLIRKYRKKYGSVGATEKFAQIYLAKPSSLAHGEFHALNSAIGMDYLRGECQEALARWQVLHRAWKRMQDLEFGHDSERYLMHGWTPAIGHIALIDFFIKLRETGLIPSHRTMIMPWPKDPIANRSLMKYWSPFFPVVEEGARIAKLWPRARFLEIPMNHFFFRDGSTLFYSHAAARAQKAWEKSGRPPLLSLSEEDRSFGLAVLRKMGLTDSDWYVALHVREPGFHRQWNDPLRMGRDVDINTYHQAVRVITAAGGWVIRLGDPSMKPLPRMPRVWDYAHSPDRSERMDIFLLGSCRFFVGTNSGVSYVPPVFGRPCLYTNWCAMDHRPWWSDNLLIHKNIRDRKTSALLPYSRLIPPPLGHVESVEFLHGQGLELLENTPEEIADAVGEMIRRVEGRHFPGALHLAQVETYRKISEAAGGYRGPAICETFLAKYSELLN